MLNIDMVFQNKSIPSTLVIRAGSFFGITGKDAVVCNFCNRKTEEFYDALEIGDK